MIFFSLRTLVFLSIACLLVVFRHPSFVAYLVGSIGCGEVLSQVLVRALDKWVSIHFLSYRRYLSVPSHFLASRPPCFAWDWTWPCFLRTLPLTFSSRTFPSSKTLNSPNPAAVSNRSSMSIRSTGTDPYTPIRVTNLRSCCACVARGVADAPSHVVQRSSPFRVPWMRKGMDPIERETNRVRKETHPGSIQGDQAPPHGGASRPLRICEKRKKHEAKGWRKKNGWDGDPWRIPASRGYGPPSTVPPGWILTLSVEGSRSPLSQPPPARMAPLESLPRGVGGCVCPCGYVCE